MKTGDLAGGGGGESEEWWEGKDLTGLRRKESLVETIEAVTIDSNLEGCYCKGDDSW